MYVEKRSIRSTAELFLQVPARVASVESLAMMVMLRRKGGVLVGDVVSIRSFSLALMLRLHHSVL